MKRFSLIVAILLLSSFLTANAQGPGNRPAITTDNAATIIELGIVDAGEYGVNSIAFSPDGTRLLTAHSKGILNEWDLATGESTQMTSPDAMWVEEAAYSPDGTQIVLTNEANILIWDAETKEPMSVLEGHETWVRHFDYSPDGALLASGADDSTIRIWSVETGETLHVLETDASTSDLAFSPDGTQIASIDGNTAGINLWDVESGDKLDGLMLEDVYYAAISYSADGTRLAAAGSRDNIYIWDVANGEVLHTLEVEAGARNADIDFSPVSQLVVTASNDSAVRIWDAERGSGYSPLRGDFLASSAVAISPDGALVAYGSADGLIYLRGVADGGPLPLPALEAYTPEPGHWEGGSSDIQVRFDVTEDGEITNFYWRWTIGASYCAIEGPETMAIEDNSFSFHPDGQLIEGRFRGAASLLGRSNVMRCGGMVFFTSGGPPTWWVHRAED